MICSCNHREPEASKNKDKACTPLRRMGWRYSSTHLYPRCYVPHVSVALPFLCRRNPVIHLIGGWIGNSTSLHGWKKRHILPLPVIAPMVVKPAAIVTGLTELSRPSETWRTAIRLWSHWSHRLESRARPHCLSVEDFVNSQDAASLWSD